MPCKELDEKTFSAPEVAAQLARSPGSRWTSPGATPQTDRLRQRFDVVGVPTVAFFRAGQEVAGTRLTGFEPPAAFLARLRRVTGD